MIIDTHCHLTYDGLSERVDEVVANALAAGVTRMITIGTAPDDARKAVALLNKFPNLRAAVGLHPAYSMLWQDRAVVQSTLRELIQLPGAGVVALGEMGLDRHYPDPPLEIQRPALEWQLEIAAEMKPPRVLPIIIHNREATADTLAMLRASKIPGERFVFHCFTGPDAELDAILDFGAMVSFTGIITFKNAQILAAAAARVPIDRIMIETDAPYLTPQPHRKVRINEPCYVKDVAEFLAAKRNMSVEDFSQRTTENALRFFPGLG